MYPVLGAPGDARRVGDDLWWADGQTGILGRVSTIDGVYTRWNVDGVGGFYGTAVDAQGRLWAVDSVESYLYRLDPDAGELCAFSLPQEGNLDYLLHQGYLYRHVSRSLDARSATHPRLWQFSSIQFRPGEMVKGFCT